MSNVRLSSCLLEKENLNSHKDQHDVDGAALQRCAAPTGLRNVVCYGTQRLRTGLTCAAPLALLVGAEAPTPKNGQEARHAFFRG